MANSLERYIFKKIFFTIKKLWDVLPIFAQ